MKNILKDIRILSNIKQVNKPNVKYLNKYMIKIKISYFNPIKILK